MARGNPLEAGAPFRIARAMPALPATSAENARGAAFMVVAMATFVVNDALMKSLSGEVPVFQAVLVRGLFATLLIGAFALARGEARLSALPVRDRKLAALRAAAEIGATACFLIALFAAPIATVTAILLASPLVITLVGATFLGEQVGWRRWSAVIVGFLGVLLIVKPGAEGFQPALLWAVASVFFVCLRDLTTRRLSPETPSMLITLMTALAITATGAVVTLWEGWEPLSGSATVRLGAAAVFVFVGYLFSVMTMRVGDIGFVSPFRYTILIWALLIGVFVFGDRPGPVTLAGAALIVLSGVYTFHRETRRVRQPR